MLARVMVVLFLFQVSFLEAGERPDVYVLLRENIFGGNKSGLLDKLDEVVAADGEKSRGRVWQSEKCDLVVSTGRAATLSALLYGGEALQSGVVSDYDWRRKPVKGVSVADRFRKAGYQTAFYGDWSLGSDGGYDSEDCGFFEGVIRWRAFKGGSLTDSWSPERTYKAISEDAKKSMDVLLGGDVAVCFFDVLGYFGKRENLVKRIAERKRDAVVLVLTLGVRDRWESFGRVTDGYHVPASLSVYYFGEKELFGKVNEMVSGVLTDGDAHGFLLGLLGEGKVEERKFRVFHKANWPVGDSPDKYRHRGSLVVGGGYALVDGLELYKQGKGMLPDLEQPLDIGEHEELHGEMLLAHSRWWAKARKALHDPRAFEVGESDNEAVRLTAMDWRGSKIVHGDGRVPSSQPLVYQKDLLGILKGMRGEKYRMNYPAHCGSWSVRIMRPGRYEITASLLPVGLKDKKQLERGKLRGGRAFVRLGRNRVELPLTKGAGAVTVRTDADAGVTDLECWFTGQLALERELGAFFVEVKRVGDKKFDFEAKKKEE